MKKFSTNRYIILAMVVLLAITLISVYVAWNMKVQEQQRAIQLLEQRRIPP